MEKKKSKYISWYEFPGSRYHMPKKEESLLGCWYRCQGCLGGALQPQSCWNGRLDWEAESYDMYPRDLGS